MRDYCQVFISVCKGTDSFGGISGAIGSCSVSTFLTILILVVCTGSSRQFYTNYNE